MPEHDTHAVGEVVEVVEFVVAAAPDSEEVEVGLFGSVQKDLVGVQVAGSRGDKVVSRDIVGSLGEDRESVDCELEAVGLVGSRTDGFVLEFDGAEAVTDDTGVT